MGVTATAERKSVYEDSLLGDMTRCDEFTMAV